MSSLSNNDDASAILGVSADGLSPKASASLGQYDSTTLVKISISGLLGVYNYGTNNKILDLDASGFWHAGESFCAAQVSVSFSELGAYTPPCSSLDQHPTPGSTYTWEQYVFVRGVGAASRSDRIPYYSSDCGGLPCHEYRGAQSVMAYPVATSLSLSPTSVTVKPGGDASFFASYAPAVVGGLTVPAGDYVWSYADSSGIRDPGCIGSSCALPSVHTSGTITCSIELNGTLKSRVAQINVIKCPTKDSILDDHTLRPAFDSLLNASLNDPAKAERGLWIWEREDGSYVTSAINSSGATFCSMSLPVPPANGLLGNLVAVIHTHPASRGASMKQCAKPGQPTAPYNPLDNGGGSDKDWTFANQFGIDVYVIGPDKVIRLDHSRYQDQSEWAKNPEHWNRNTNSCPWAPL